MQAAEHGEQILIMRGSKPAVALTPVSEADLTFWPSVPASALAEFDREIEAERKNGNLKRLGANAAGSSESTEAVMDKSIYAARRFGHPVMLVRRDSLCYL